MDLLKEGIGLMKNSIEDGNLECQYKVMDVSLENEESLIFIRSLNASDIDWSNIPDYTHPKEFLTLTKACNASDGQETTHKCHFMNWSN